ncbi:hypothetical protein D3C71_1994790 [compost metagenome]
MLIKDQYAETPLEHQQGFSLIVAQVPMRRDVSRWLQANGHAMARLFHLMEVVVLTPARTGRGFLGQVSKQCLIEKARRCHVYIPLTA